MSGIVRTERVQVVVIGAGQAGLSVGYHLAQRGVQFVILEANERIGDSWRERWDSLRLFTPGRLDGLDGMPFPTPGHRFPTKDEMAERADQPTPRGIAAAEGNHMIMGQGAVPIIRNGVVEGACGVSGGTAQEDEDCARAGIARL